MAQANEQRPRRAATSPGSSAPMPAIRPRASRIAFTVRTWPRDRQGCRSPSTCRPKPGSIAITSLARGEVGRVGVAISDIGDMRALFEDIPLTSMNTSMTINATAPWLMALYIAVADEQGAPAPAPGHDAERHHQGISRPRGLHLPARRVAPADQGHDPVLRPGDAEVEPDECVLLPSSGSGRDARPGTDLLPRDSDRGARPGPPIGRGRRGRVRGGRRPDFVLRQRRHALRDRLAKMRAFVELWDEITRDRFGVQDPPTPLPLRRSGQFARTDRAAA